MPWYTFRGATATRPSPSPSQATPSQSAPPGGRGKLTLAAVVGAGVATALGFTIPYEESGRTVETSLGSEGQLVQKHIRGRQYLQAYVDIAGVPTICDGLTRINGRRVTTTDTLSEEQCAEYLEEELVTHAVGVMACSPGLALSNDPALETMREGPRFAAVSLAYNIGVGGYCGSTARRRFNAGDFSGGCSAITRWNKARVNGVLRPVTGLTRRRAREYNVCINGLDAISDYR